MEKRHILINYYLAIAFASLVTASCSGQLDENPSANETVQFHVSAPTGKNLTMELNYYIFQEGTLDKKGHGLISPFHLSVPKGARVFFFAGEMQPIALSTVETGKTTLDEFLGIRTEKNQAPSEFYTGDLTRTDDSAYNIPLTIGEAQIDLDVTSSKLLHINNIRIENASASTLLFLQESPKSLTPKMDQTQEFNPPVKGKKENILRIYESDTPVSFSVNGEYDGVPLSFRTSLPQVLRNTKYTLKVMNSGAEMTGFFSVDQWSETDTVNTGTNADEKLLIDMKHSVFPEGTVVSESRQSLNVPYTGGDVTLAFMAESAVDFESIIDDLSNMQIDLLEVRREEDKILTRYRIRVKGQGENTLPYPTVLNVKSILRQHSTNIITLIVGAPPLYIREVTLGGVTWMAFNARSHNTEDQIYPIKGYSVEEMYNYEWLTSLGGLFQHGRNYMYVPWESGINNQGNQADNHQWTDAKNTPCPEGYRIPTTAELRSLFGNGTGMVPGGWNYNGERITASEVTASNSQININGVTGVAKYLKLSGARGGKMYIPYGGSKSSISPSSKDPLFEQGFRLWGSETASSLYYGDPTGLGGSIKIFSSGGINRESYCYVRCIKI